MNWQKFKFYALIFGISAFMVGIGISQRSKEGSLSPELNSQLSNISASQIPNISSIPQQLSEDFIQIAKKVTPSVVSIEVKREPLNTQPLLEEGQDFFDRFFNQPHGNQPDSGEPVSGSGVIIDADKGYIVTNNHVIEDAQEIQVILSNQQHVRAQLVGTDEKTDLAVIQIGSVRGLQPAKLANSDKVRVGEWVLAIGNPFGLSSSVTAGIISAIGRADMGIADFEDFIQTDAAINPGNSGGALINTYGELIGINTAIATRTAGYMGIGFAIPSNMTQKITQELILHGTVSRSQLGVYIRQMEPALAKSLGLPQSHKGIVVTDVIPGSPAELAGLKRYDVILALNGNEANDVNQFRNVISLTSSGTEIRLKVFRENKMIEIKPVLQSVKPVQKSQVGQKSEQLVDKLGFQVKIITPETAEKLQIPIHRGVEVALVQQISRAFEEGLVVGDVILEVNRKEIHSIEDFNRIVMPLKKGDVLLLSILNEDETRLIAFELD